MAFCENLKCQIAVKALPILSFSIYNFDVQYVNFLKFNIIEVIILP